MKTASASVTVLAVILGIIWYNSDDMPSETHTWAKRMAEASQDNLEKYSTMNKTAFVLGFTGETGKALVKELGATNIFSKVVLIGRREVKYEDETLQKFEQRVVDFDKLDEHKDKFAGLDVGFCCMGTTRGKAGKEGFIKVDHDYVVNAAKVAKDSGCEHFHLVSSSGANDKSWFLYPKIKGQTEEELKALEFPRLSVYRPALLLCDRSESRPTEKAAHYLMKPMATMFPTVGTVPVESVAKAMIHSTVSPSDKKSETLDNKAIHQLAGELAKKKAEKKAKKQEAASE